MRLLTHTVTPQEAGLPVRTLLRRQLRISGSFLAKLKWRPGAITLNGIPVIVSTRTEAGDVLAADVSDLPGENPHIRPVAYPLDILWEDEDLLLLNKPAGIAIHPSALTEETVTVAGAVCHYLRTGSFHCVNRLDRGTTGVMAVAKTGYIHRLCMESLHTDSFLREYRGICLGAPQPPSGSIDLPISRDPGSLLRRTVDPMGLPARTLYETLLPGGAVSAAAAAPDGPHPPAAAPPLRRGPPAGWGLALRHRGPRPHPPSGAALLPSPAPAPRDPPLAGCHRPAAGGYAPPAPAGL